MAITVLDSTNLPAILADAGVTLDEQTEQNIDSEKDKENKTPGEVDTSSEHEDSDDVEGDDGLTARQKRELTEKMQKAIGKKHRMVKEAEEFAAAQYSERKLAEQRAHLLEQELAALKSASTATAVAQKPSEKPRRENFATENEYIDSMIQFGVDQRLREKAAEDAKAAAEAARLEIIAAAEARIARGRELVPDFDEVVNGIDVAVPPAIAGYMQKSDMFAELGYHLAKNPEILVSLAKLPADEQLVKIGKIESKLIPFGSESTRNDSTSSNSTSNGQVAKTTPSADTGNTPSKPRSNTAPVITPLDAAGVAGASKDSKDMNIRESIEDFSKRNRLNLGIRKRH